MEAGAHGAPMDRAVVQVGQKSELDPVTIHSHNMEVKPVQDKPRRLLAVTRIHVRKVRLKCQKDLAMMLASLPPPPLDLKKSLFYPN